jgi:hypothetical protein
MLVGLLYAFDCVVLLSPLPFPVVISGPAFVTVMLRLSLRVQHPGYLQSPLDWLPIQYNLFLSEKSACLPAVAKRVIIICWLLRAFGSAELFVLT